jgi:hypothetical protein
LVAFYYKDPERKHCASWAPVTLAKQEAEIRRITAWANSLRDPISKVSNTKKGLVEWLK